MPCRPVICIEGSHRRPRCKSQHVPAALQQCKSFRFQLQRRYLVIANCHSHPASCNARRLNHAHARQSGTGNWLLPSKKASSLPRCQRDREVPCLPASRPTFRTHLPTRATPGPIKDGAHVCSYQAASSIVPRTTQHIHASAIISLILHRPYRLPRAPSATTVLQIASPGGWPPSSPALLAAVLPCTMAPASGFVTLSRPRAYSLPCSGQCFYLVFLLRSRSLLPGVFPFK